MYDRMTDKSKAPGIADIENFIGKDSMRRLIYLEKMLHDRYVLSREKRYPFGASYGWGYKYSHRTAHLFYLFFEKDALTATLQIGDKEVPALLEQLQLFSPKAQALWETRYPCGKNGGWIHYRILSDDELDDVVGLIAVKKKPLKKPPCLEET